MTFQQFKIQSIKELSGSPSPSLDVEVLMQWILKKDKSYILFHRDEELSEEQESQLKKSISLRKTGLPIAYITGHKEFYGIDFIVSPDVLIPKPDTEVLVENSIEIIRCLQDKSDHTLNILDMCTGSGCVAISIIKTLKDLHSPGESNPKFTLADISNKALDIARENARRILDSETLSKVTFVSTNLFKNLKDKSFDLIVSNPPYVPCDQTTELLKDGRNEPRLALDGDIDIEGNPSGTKDGLEIIRNLVSQAKSHLTENGMLILETGEYNAMETACLMKKIGFRDVKTYVDLEGDLRNVSGKN
ncbi:MAG: peptide chain release factor N(5)-glutamine methyltransferase [Treponema sp.]|nr:peptide chain release factor N(5)-glutamine methyltransferase [Treponema sp.]MDY5837523.1 peptide chain release factor N(5)-glutamine methyltransferase [Treponema sp.]